MSQEQQGSGFATKRVTALIGPYGAGKSEIALGLARRAAAAEGPDGPRRTVLGDLDVLKPYFRSREAAMRLREARVDVLAPPGALANSDLPIVTPQLRGAIGRADLTVILDVGGDATGARALGSISDVLAGADADVLLVLNRNRPFMDSVESVVAQARQIEAASRLRLTGLVSNTHLLEATTPDDVLWGLELAREVAAAIALDVRFVGAPRPIAQALGRCDGLPPVMAIDRAMAPFFLGGVVLAPAPGAVGSDVASRTGSDR